MANDGNELRQAEAGEAGDEQPQAQPVEASETDLPARQASETDLPVKNAILGRVWGGVTYPLERLREKYPRVAFWASVIAMVLFGVGGIVLRSSPIAGLAIMLFSGAFKAVDDRLLAESKDRLKAMTGRTAGLINATQQHLNRVVEDATKKWSLGDNVRVTFFVPSQDEKQLLIAARWSVVRGYRKRDNRVYDIARGCIGEAWEKGRASDCDFPDPKKQWSAYCDKHHSRWGLSRDEVAQMTMKSRCYYCFRVRAVGTAASADGVVAIESTKCRIQGIIEVTAKLTDAGSSDYTEMQGLLEAASALVACRGGEFDQLAKDAGSL